MSCLPTTRRTPDLAPSSTTILVTGANGFLVSHIITEALSLGYKVRGTARTFSKASATDNLYGNHANYHAVIVSDFATSVDEITAAVRDVESIIHVASDLSFSNDAATVITTVVNGTTNLPRAAAKEASVKRFVLTSSSVAMIQQVFGAMPERQLTTETWNETSIYLAYDPKPDTHPLMHAGDVYAASKIKGERAFWEFVNSEKPTFVANAILPNVNFGRVLAGGPTGVTGTFVPEFYKTKSVPMLPPMHFINVTDTARLHLIAAVLDAEIANERIAAVAGDFNVNDLIDAIAKARPGFDVKHIDDKSRDLTRFPKERGAALLKEWFGQDGYRGLEESVRENLVGLE